jgi:hypothetical protein
MKVSSTGKFAPSGFLVILLTKTNKTHMVSSLMLLQRYKEHCEALLRINVTEDETWFFHYTIDGKADSMT